MKTRAQKILESIILMYTEQAVPVGSESLLERFGFGVSSATIRNVMAELEEMGLLTHPHTSAGRVPTDRGYRYYVDLLMEVPPISPAEDSQIREIEKARLSEPLDLLEEASRILSDLTKEAGVALMPQFIQGSFRRLELIQLGKEDIVAILVSNEGLVRHAQNTLKNPIDSDTLKYLQDWINESLEGILLADAPKILMESWQDLENRTQQDWQEIFRWIIDSPLFHEEPSVVLEGVSWIFEAPEFKDVEKIRRLIQALDGPQELAKILQRDLWADSVKIHIGSENRGTHWVDCAVVAAPYRLAGGMVGAIGVVGPVRLNYPRVTGLVQRMAERVTSVMHERWGV
jgi:heat-inducible transcriptional repressor